MQALRANYISLICLQQRLVAPDNLLETGILQTHIEIKQKKYCLIFTMLGTAIVAD